MSTVAVSRAEEFAPVESALFQEPLSRVPTSSSPSGVVGSTGRRDYQTDLSFSLWLSRNVTSRSSGGWWVILPSTVIHAPPVFEEPDTEPARLPAERLVEAHDVSGLTWDQIAKYFGVSRRAVHLWVAGGRMSAANEELLARLMQAVDSVRHLEQSTRRLALLDSSSGLNIIDRQRAARSSSDADINRSPEIGIVR